MNKNSIFRYLIEIDFQFYRFRETAKLKDLPSNILPEDVVNEAIDEIGIGDTVTVADFIRKYGSHYIASYVTGNSLYQVRPSYLNFACDASGLTD